MLHLTSETFEIEAARGNLPVLVMFYAAWCSKCAMMKPMIEDLEPAYRGKIRFCEVDIEECEDLAECYGTDIIPTFVILKGGKTLSTFRGVFSEQSFRSHLQEIFRNC